MTDPVKAIARRIGHRCRRFAVTEIRSERSTPWRSLLFDGGRHHIELSLRGDGVDAALTALEDEIAAAGLRHIRTLHCRASDCRGYTQWLRRARHARCAHHRGLRAGRRLALHLVTQQLEGHMKRLVKQFIAARLDRFNSRSGFKRLRTRRRRIIGRRNRHGRQIINGCRCRGDRLQRGRGRVKTSRRHHLPGRHGSK